MSQGLNPDTIERSMFDVLVHRLPIHEVIHHSEVDVAVSSIDLAGAELALSSMIGRERALEKAIAPVKDTYDYILIDTPPSLGLLTINALVASNGVIVPVQCEYLSLRGLVQLENTLTMIRENLNPEVGIEGILPTMYDSRTLHSREAVEILQENFGDLVFNTRIRKTDPLRGGSGEGQLRPQVRPQRAAPPRPTETWRRRCSMARRRASMREGPLAELFRATEAAQRAGREGRRARAAAGSGRGGHGRTDAGRAAREDRRARPRVGRQRRPDSAAASPPSPFACRSARRSPSAKPSASARGPKLEPLPEPPPRLHRVARAGRVHRRHPRRRGRRRRPQRGQPHDRRRHLAGRVRRRQHRHPAAPDERRAGQDPHRPRADARASAQAPIPTSAAAPPKSPTTRSSARCAARTWSS